MRVGLRPSSPDQSLTLPELRPTFGRKLLDRERGSARHCGLNLLAHLSLGRSGTPLRGGGVLFRHAASLSGMSQLTACAISTSQGTRSGSGRGMRPSANALASSMRFWGKVQGAGLSHGQRKRHLCHLVLGIFPGYRLYSGVSHCIFCRPRRPLVLWFASISSGTMRLEQVDASKRCASN